MADERGDGARTAAQGIRRFAAFISYSHSDDEIGDWLHRRLENYSVPSALANAKSDGGPSAKKLGKVFRDRADLSAAHDLGQEIRQGLEQSDALIVLCSPRARGSKYVNEEIRTFKQLGKGQRIFAAIVGGEPHAAGRPGFSADDECFPPSLIYALGPDGELSTQPEPNEPIAADFRKGKDGRENGAIKLIAGLLGVPLDELVQREKQAEARRRRRAYALAGLMAVLAAGAAGAGVFAWTKQNEAIEERDRALAGQSQLLATQAEVAIGQGRSAEAISLALDALPKSMTARDRPYVPAAEAALLHGLLTLREKSIYDARAGAAWEAVISPSGRKLATLADGGLWLWDTEKVALERQLVPPGNPPAEGKPHHADVVAIDPTEKWIAAGMVYADVWLWDLASGKETRLQGHTERIAHVAFSPDGGMVASGSFDHTARVWRTSDGALLKFIDVHKDRVTDIAFDPAGARMVSSSNDGTVRIWNTADWSLIRTIEHGTNVGFSRFSPDGTVLLVASRRDVDILMGERIGDEPLPNAAAFYDPVTGERLGLLTGHTNFVEDAEFTVDGTRMLTVSRDGTARMWTAPTGELEGIYGMAPPGSLASTHGLHHGRFIDDGRRFITTGNDGSIRIWKVNDPTNTEVLNVHGDAVSGLSVSADRTLFATASADGTARVWASSSPQDLSIIRVNDPRLKDLRSKTSSSQVAATPTKPRPYVRIRGSVVSLGSRIRLEGHTGQISRYVFSPDNTLIVTICGSVAGPMGFGPRGRDYTARVWSVDTGESVAVLQHEGAVERAMFGAEPGTLITASQDGRVRIWRLPTGTVEKTLPAGGRIAEMILSEDGSQLAVAAGNAASVWRVADGEMIAQMVGHTSLVESLSFNMDGTKLLTAGREGAAQLWSVETGETLKTFDTGSEINFSGFLANDTRIATAMTGAAKYHGDGGFGIEPTETASRSIVIWDVATGERLVDLRHDGAIGDVSIIDDGRAILSDQRIWILPLTTDAAISAGHAAMAKRAFAPEPPQ